MENLFRTRPRTFFSQHGDPAKTSYVEQFWRLANAAASLPDELRPTQMFLKSADYQAVIAELRAQYNAPWHMTDPPYLIFGSKAQFKVLPAGTEDQGVVNRMNSDTPGAIDFADRLKKFEVTYDQKKIDTSQNANTVVAKDEDYGV